MTFDFMAQVTSSHLLPHTNENKKLEQNVEKGL